MTMRLDPVVRAGGLRCAALCRVEVSRHGWRRGAVFAARKEPVAILFAGSGGVRAISVDGAPLTGEEIDALCPGAMAGFAALAD